MVTVLMTHEVKDFETWKKGFEEGEGLRAGAGITTNAVYTSVDNENLVTVSVNFPGVEAVHGFVSSPQLAEAMEAAGVLGKPELTILQQR